MFLKKIWRKYMREVIFYSIKSHYSHLVRSHAEQWFSSAIGAKYRVSWFCTQHPTVPRVLLFDSNVTNGLFVFVEAAALSKILMSVWFQWEKKSGGNLRRDKQDKIAQMGAKSWGQIKSQLWSFCASMQGVKWWFNESHSPMYHQQFSQCILLNILYSTAAYFKYSAMLANPNAIRNIFDMQLFVASVYVLHMNNIFLPNLFYLICPLVDQCGSASKLQVKNVCSHSGTCRCLCLFWKS